MKKKALDGVLFPLVTPFQGDNETVNYEGLKQLIDFLIKNGTTGVIPCGSTGELVSMSLEEHLAINEFTIKYVNKRVKVFACTGAYRTADAVQLSKAAEDAGADGVMVVTPWYITPNEAEVYQHYKTIREAVTLPIILYHNPYFTTCWLTDKFIARLYNDGIIDGVKERHEDIGRYQNMRALTDDNFGIFYGFDGSPAEALSFYADGWITGVGTLFPAETVKLYNLAKAQRINEAKKFAMETVRPYMLLFNETTKEGLPAPWLSIIKEGLTMRGLDIGVPRKPVLPLPDDVREKLKNLMIDYGYYAGK